MNIGVIGRGTVSASAIMMIYLKFKDRFPHSAFKVTCIYDPAIPVIQVGETGSPFLYQRFNELFNLGLEEEFEQFDGTLRYYTRYDWQEANGRAPFRADHQHPGLHLNSQKFSVYMLDKVSKMFSNFTQIEDNITDITQENDIVTVHGKKDQYTFDWVIDSRGSPSDEDLAGPLYAKPDVETVNSAIIYPEFLKYDEPYTSSYYHKNGWMFGIPLTYRKTFGYLYNNNVTSYEEACEHFSSLKPGIEDATKLVKFTWKQYYRKRLADGRIITMGNKLYFFEPHQALPLFYAAIVAEELCFELLKMNQTPEQIEDHLNAFHTDSMCKIQNLISLCYQAEITGEKSAFWQRTYEKTQQRLIQSDDFQAWLKEVEKSGKFEWYWRFSPAIMRNYIQGFNIDLKSITR